MRSGKSLKKKVSLKKIQLLTDQQQIFVSQYPIHWNGARAAADAGYANPAVSACKLLKNPIIQQAVAWEKEQLIKKLGISPSEVLFHLWCMATVNGGDFTDETGKIITDMNALTVRAKNCIAGIEQTVTTYTSDDGAVTEEVTTKLKLTNKNDAINTAMKHKGLFEANNSQLPGGLIADWNTLYGRPKDALEPDIIEVEVAPKRLEEKQ